MNPKDYILGEEAYRQSEKSLKALVTHLNKGIKDPIYLTINLNNPIVRENDYIPRLIPLSNKFSSPKLSSMKILLITKNDLNGENYRNVIKAKESPISELFHDIITLKKLKKIALNKKKLNNFYNEFDMIICDNRISKLLFKIIGGDSLYSKKKKIPFLIQMAKPDFSSSKLILSQQRKLKDERCDVKYILKQMKFICQNTNFIPSGSGTCLSIKIGYANMNIQEMIENINDVLNFLIDNKNKNVICGKENLIKGGIKLYKDVHIRSESTISLPIYYQNK